MLLLKLLKIIGNLHSSWFLLLLLEKRQIAFNEQPVTLGSLMVA